MTTTFTGPEVTEFDNGYKMISWPAVTYIQPIDPETAMNVPANRLAVPFPTRRSGAMHKAFGVCMDEGQPKAYGLAVSVSTVKCAPDLMPAQEIGGLVKIEGKLYRIERAPNDNITFVAE